MELTQMDRESLYAFAAALEDFIQNVNAHCAQMETGISDCQRYMRDESSQIVLREGQQACADIRACVNPAQMLLEHIRILIQILDNAPEMGG